MILSVKGSWTNTITNVQAYFSSVVCVYVCVSVGHVHEPFKACRTDRYVVCVAGSGGPNKPSIRGVKSQREWAI